MSKGSLTKQQTQNYWKCLLAGATELMGGNVGEITDDHVGAVMNSYYNEVNGVPTRYFHTDEHPLKTTGEIDPRMEEVHKEIEKAIAQYGNKPLDPEEATRIYLDAISLHIPKEESLRIGELEFSALTHDIIYGTDGQMETKAKEMLIKSGTLQEQQGERGPILVWNTIENAPMTHSLLSQENVMPCPPFLKVLGPYGTGNTMAPHNEILSGIIAEVLLNVLEVPKESQLCITSTILKTVPFASREQQVNLDNAIEMYGEKNDINIKDVNRAKQEGRDFANLADVASFGTTKIGLESHFITREGHLNRESSPNLRTTNYDGYDVAGVGAPWFYDNVLIPNVQNNQKSVFHGRPDDLITVRIGEEEITNTVQQLNQNAIQNLQDTSLYIKTSMVAGYLYEILGDKGTTTPNLTTVMENFNWKSPTQNNIPLDEHVTGVLELLNNPNHQLNGTGTNAPIGKGTDTLGAELLKAFGPETIDTLAKEIIAIQRGKGTQKGMEFPPLPMPARLENLKQQQGSFLDLAKQELGTEVLESLEQSVNKARELSEIKEMQKETTQTMSTTLSEAKGTMNTMLSEAKELMGQVMKKIIPEQTTSETYTPTTHETYQTSTHAERILREKEGPKNQKGGGGVLL